MATLGEIRQGLANNLRGLKGVQVLPYISANPKPPTVWVMPASTTYDQAMQRGLDTILMTVQGFVAMPVPRRSQELLDALMEPTGSQSVKTLIESDRTLGGVVDYVRVTESSGYQTAVVEGKGSVLLCEWTVAVMASN